MKLCSGEIQKTSIDETQKLSMWRSAHGIKLSPTDRFKAVLQLQFVFVCTSMVSYVALILSLFGPHLFFRWYHGKLCFISREGFDVVVAFPVYLHIYFMIVY